MAFLTIAHPPQILTQIAAGTTSIVNATCTEVTYTVTGLTPDMSVQVSMSGTVPANIGIVNEYVSAANTLKVRFINPTAAPISLTNACLLNIIAF